MPRYAETQKLLERDLSGVSPDSAVKNIEMWEEALGGVDAKEAKALAKDLGALKRALGKKEPNGEEIQALLQKLGEQTVALADQAPEATAEKLRQIGDRLSNAAVDGDVDDEDGDTKASATDDEDEGTDTADEGGESKARGRTKAKAKG